MPRWICDQDRYALIIRDMESGNGVCTCAYCGEELVLGDSVSPASCEIDHKNPRSKGGDMLSPKNLVCACRDCNGKKSDTDFSLWMASLPGRAASEERLRVRDDLSNDWARFVSASKALGYRR
jgi:5-methylcytosine-specific restriction endonuclease McrA